MTADSLLAQKSEQYIAERKAHEAARAELATLRASNAALAGRCAGLEKRLFATIALIDAMRFEPDIGKPHPLKDGIADKIVADARSALSEETPWPLEWRGDALCLGRIKLGHVGKSSYDDCWYGFITGTNITPITTIWDEQQARAAVEAAVRNALEGK